MVTQNRFYTPVMFTRVEFKSQAQATAKAAEFKSTYPKQANEA